MHDYLKTKVISLVDEAKTIRRLENRRLRLFNEARQDGNDQRAEYQETVFKGLRGHRITVVRDEARASHLAYGFLRGQEYKQMERRADTMPDWKKIRKLACRYSEYDPLLTREAVDTWISEGKEHWYDAYGEHQEKIRQKQARRAEAEMRKTQKQGTSVSPAFVKWLESRPAKHQANTAISEVNAKIVGGKMSETYVPFPGYRD